MHRGALHIFANILHKHKLDSTNITRKIREIEQLTYSICIKCSHGFQGKERLHQEYT